MNYTWLFVPVISYQMVEKYLSKNERSHASSRIYSMLMLNEGSLLELYTKHGEVSDVICVRL